MIGKNRTKNSVYITFLDLEKAFDRMPLKIIWNILEDRKVNPKLIKGIKSLYTKNTNCKKRKYAVGNILNKGSHTTGSCP